MTVALAVDDLSAGFRGVEVLHQVSFELRTGEWLGLIGPNGAGKSTLLGAIVGLVDHSGSVTEASGTHTAQYEPACTSRCAASSGSRGGPGGRR